jgi:hypothetical protein
MFSIVALRDNKLNIQLAESSRRIAEESRLDNLLNVKLAKATAQLAEETRQDSAAMKTIAVLTLTFLPGTAVAVSLPYVHPDFKYLCSHYTPTVFFRNGRNVQLGSPTGREAGISIRVDLLRHHGSINDCCVLCMVLVVPENEGGIPKAVRRFRSCYGRRGNDETNENDDRIVEYGETADGSSPAMMGKACTSKGLGLFSR